MCYYYSTSIGAYFFAPIFIGGKNGFAAGNGLSAVEGGKIIRRCRKVRVKITLACTECKQRNYNTKKNKKNDPDRIEMTKYCKFCRKHTPHRETK